MIAARRPRRVRAARLGLALCATLLLCACGDDAPRATPLAEADLALLSQAEAMLYAQAPEQVPALLAGLLARDPVPVEAAYLAGQAAYYLQDYGECVRRLDDVLARDPERYLSRCNALGFAHYKRGEYDAARAIFERITAADPNESKAYYGLAQVALAEGRPEQARPLLERSLALRPDYLKARFALVRLLDDEGRTEEALLANEQLLAAWPSNEEALFLHVRLLRQLGRDEDAEVVEARRATVYATKEQIASLAQRIRAGDDDGPTRLMLVASYLQLGDLGEARDALRAALAVHPDDAELIELAERLELR